jgi:K+ transporter
VAGKVDNDGEGGILALMSLLGVKRQHRPLIVAVGLFGAALIYGDGAITPAISVLSALEGLDIVTSTFHPYILPRSDPDCALCDPAAGHEPNRLARPRRNRSSVGRWMV